MSDLYSLLGVRRTARPAAIEKAYRKRAKETHPDRGGDADAFGRVEAAYRVLIDPARRARYDATGDASPPRPDESAQHACRVLGWALAQALEALAKRGIDPTRYDVVRAMREAIQAKADEMAAARKEAEKRRKLLETVAARVGTDGPENVVADVARMQAGQLGTVLEQMAAERGHFDRAAELLKRYRYAFEDPIFQPGSWRTGFVLTAS